MTLNSTVMNDNALDKTNLTAEGSNIKVDRGIPLPGHIGSKGRAAKYPFDEMRAGDSFEIPTHKAGLRGCRVINAFAQWRISRGRKNLGMLSKLSADGASRRFWIMEKKASK